MSVFKVVKYDNDNMRNLQNRLLYIRRPSATRISYVYGVGVSEFHPYEFMEMVKDNYQQTEGKSHFHYILNIGDEEVSVKNLKDASCEIAKFIAGFCGCYQVISAIHFDSEFLHTHFIANNIDCENGTRFDLNKARLAEMKMGINDILNHYDISPIRGNQYIPANDEGDEEDLSE